ncbi:efflux RND transporter periplasmic adaptor subunit [Allosphingosinicella deserti]|uniref:Efflux transporter periplasmic adaptor subunit n=1 Tax=Allosphingosinicella deserti TaxID=2116704 RepID=A0A2P7QRI3_9SPHN|nr:HlyD family efflux transporter periplasmic adaptor subunit [Sphingomonas deserti]PSJ40583.1 efflux transporter periplasmic adaptor subunit [Sphingomonas deserti]
MQTGDSPPLSWRPRAVPAALGAALLLLAGAGLYTAGAASGSDPAAPLNRPAAASADATSLLPLDAHVEPRTATLVTAVQGGQIAHIRAADGSMVAHGAPLAEIANPQFVLAVASQEAEIISRLGDLSAQNLGLQRGRRADSQEIAAAELALHEAEDELRRQTRLFEAGVVTAARIKPLEARAAFHRDKVAALRAAAATEHEAAASQQHRLAKAERQLDANLGTVRATLDTLVLRAPAAGRLTNFRLRPGQPVAAGDTLGQVDGDDGYKLYALVDEAHLGRVAAGQAARARIAGAAVPLVVARVDPQVAEGRFKIELHFRGPTPATLRRGQRVRAELALAPAETG